MCVDVRDDILLSVARRYGGYPECVQSRLCLDSSLRCIAEAFGFMAREKNTDGDRHLHLYYCTIALCYYIRIPHTLQNIVDAKMEGEGI